MTSAAPDANNTHAAAGERGAVPARRWPWALAAAAVGAAAPLGAVLVQGLPPGAATAAIAAAAALASFACVALAASRSRVAAAPATASTTEFDNRADEPRSGPALMAAQVVPVWQRQLEASRTLAEQGVGGLLHSFNAVSDGLNAALQAASAGHGPLGAGSADELLDRNQALLDELLQPVASLREARSSTERELAELAELMQAFQHAAKDMDSLARHARLVAMNAAIEANRAGQSQGGFGAVAREVLEISSSTGAGAQSLLQRFGQAQRRLDALRRRLELDTGNDETLQLQVRQRARHLLAALVGDLGQATASSRQLREAGEGLQHAIDEMFMGFQFQDRFSQMMGSVTGDMQRFCEWLASGSSASHKDAADWLMRLDASYTMEEQRAHHHGTVQIARGPVVEFF